MIKIKKRTPLEMHAERYAQLQKKINQLHVEHQTVFDKEARLKTEAEAELIRIKDLARQQSEAGRSRVVVDTDHVVVEVVGRQASQVYDVKLAAKRWPQQAYSRALVTSIDNTAVAEMLERGDISQKLVDAVALPREPITPAVTVRVL